MQNLETSPLTSTQRNNHTKKGRAISPRSPDFSPRDFFLWGYVKGPVFVPSLPANIEEIKQKITAALETVTEDMLQRVWHELQYRLDMCRVTQAALILNIYENLSKNQQISVLFFVNLTNKTYDL